MKRREIHFVFDESTGACEMEAVGFQGKECFAATDPYAKALGVVTESTKTADYNRTPPKKQRVAAQ